MYLGFLLRRLFRITPETSEFSPRFIAMRLVVTLLSIGLMLLFFAILSLLFKLAK